MSAHATIRAATTADAGAIAELLAAGTLTPDAEDPAAAWRYAAAIERIREQHGEVLVAERDAAVVGVCQVLLLEHLQHQGGCVAELESLHVAAAERSQGIGTKLLDAAGEWARERGCYRIQLTSNAVREDAHRFYDRNGYTASHVGFKQLLDAEPRDTQAVISPRGPATPPRLAPLDKSERTDMQRELLLKVDVGGVMGESNIFTTLVRAPDVFRPWLRFGGALLGGSLPPRDRELLILRTAVHCTAPYEWGQHVLIARRVGLTNDEIARVAVLDADGWSADDALVLRAADELHAMHTLGDEIYDALAARYDEPQLIEFAMVVGSYGMLAMTLNMLGVPLDEGLAQLPS